MHINKKMDASLSTILNLNPQKNISTLGFFDNYPVLDYYLVKKG